MEHEAAKICGEMVPSTAQPPIVNGALGFSHRHPLRFRWCLNSDGGACSSAFAGKRTRGHAFRFLTVPNVSSKKGSSNEVIMVDPLEAKRLAAKQMVEIQAKEKFKRKRQIEAINGAWAMIGLTVGLIIEGQTGKGIVEQLAGYWSSIAGIFMK